MSNLELVAGDNIILTEGENELTISADIPSAYAWNPLVHDDSEGGANAFLTFDSYPTGFLKDDTSWWFAVRIADCAIRKDQSSALFCSNVSSGGIGIYTGLGSGDTGYWAKMSSSGYLIAQTVDTPVSPNIWLVGSFNHSAGQATFWVGDTKTNDGTSVTFASSEPTSLVFGSESAGYNGAYFYNIFGLNISNIIIGVGDTLTDLEAGEFIPSLGGSSANTSLTFDAKVDYAWSFDENGAVTDKGAINLTPTITGAGAYSMKQVLI